MCQAVFQLEAETQQVFQENQQLNKQSTLLNNDVSMLPKRIYCPSDKLLLFWSVCWWNACSGIVHAVVELCKSLCCLHNTVTELWRRQNVKHQASGAWVYARLLMSAALQLTCTSGQQLAACSCCRYGP